LFGTVIIVLLPGPNSLYVATVAARQGPARAWRAALGIFTGDTVLILATAAGAASLIHLFPLAFKGFKLVGAFYLGWIGFELLREGWQRLNHKGLSNAEVTGSTTPERMHKAPYLRALGLSLTNPKAILFFLAFFTQFVSPTSESIALSYFVLGLVVQIVSLSYLWILIIAGHKLARQFHVQPQWAGVGLMVVGLFFIGFALRLMQPS
jgi:leucine efflux protein